jgi:hypothetical protein
VKFFIAAPIHAYSTQLTVSIREIEANAAGWELYMCSPDELREEAEKNPDGRLELYALWRYNHPAWRKSLPWYKEDEGKDGTQKSEGSQETDNEGEGTGPLAESLDNTGAPDK